MSNRRIPRQPGPKTIAGKRQSSKNSRKHGMCAAKPDLEKKEAAIFAELIPELSFELQVNTPLRALLFDDFITCYYRVKQGRRLEQAELRRQLKMQKIPSVPTAQELQLALRLLTELSADVGERSYVSEEWETRITAAFGPDFWKTLRDWNPIGAGSSQRGLTLQKFIEVQAEKLRHALDKLNSQTQGSNGEAANRLELFSRYQTTARRDFYRALREYREVQNPRLRAK